MIEVMGEGTIVDMKVEGIEIISHKVRIFPMTIISHIVNHDTTLEIIFNMVILKIIFHIEIIPLITVVEEIVFHTVVVIGIMILLHIIVVVGIMIVMVVIILLIVVIEEIMSLTIVVEEIVPHTIPIVIILHIKIMVVIMFHTNLIVITYPTEKTIHHPLSLNILLLTVNTHPLLTSHLLHPKTPLPTLTTLQMSQNSSMEISRTILIENKLCTL